MFVSYLRKAGDIHWVLKLGRIYKLKIKSQLDLFDKMVKPMLLYGCEVWGFGDNAIIERAHLKLYKLLLNSKTSTPSYMVHGELGRYPIELDIKLRIISYWTKLIYHTYMTENLPLKWIKFTENIFHECGFSYIWDGQNFPHENWLKAVIFKQRLMDQFIQNWFSKIIDSPKTINYRIFKTKFEFEEYLNVLKYKNAVLLCRFRTCNTKLPIETGRWLNIPRHHRVCILCINRNIRDEYHYLFECQFFAQKRKECLPKYFITRHNTLKCSELMSTRSKPILKNYVNL